MIHPHLQNVVKRIYDEAASRYDWQHYFLTAGSDKRGRIWLVNKTVGPGMHILDNGAGTGSTGIMAARITGQTGSVTFFDLSEGMLQIARKKVEKTGLSCPVYYQQGDMHHLPFEDEHFDTVLATYSLDPLKDPMQAFHEMYRVTKPGGLIGVAHETVPQSRFLNMLTDKIERIIWHLPSLSLACRPVNIWSGINQLNGYLTEEKKIGVPLWPFQLLIFRKKVT